MEAFKFKGEADFQAKVGISTECDVFASGVRIINVGLDMGTHLNMGIAGEIGYGTDSLYSPWSWEGDLCFTTNIGAGAIFRAAVNLGIKIDTRWKKLSTDYLYKYTYQSPTDNEMNSPGWHDAWYSTVGEEICMIKTVTSSATGQVWMDRNLGASRVATSMTDTEAYGDLYHSTIKFLKVDF